MQINQQNQATFKIGKEPRKRNKRLKNSDRDFEGGTNTKRDLYDSNSSSGESDGGQERNYHSNGNSRLGIQQ